MSSATGWWILNLAARKREAPGDLVAKLRMPSLEETVLMELEVFANSTKELEKIEQACSLGFSEKRIAAAIRKGIQSEIKAYEMLYHERGYLHRGMMEHLAVGLEALDKGMKQYINWLRGSRNAAYRNTTY